MEQKNGWFAFWQKLMKCLSKQDETGVGDTKSVAISVSSFLSGRT